MSCCLSFNPFSGHMCLPVPPIHVQAARKYGKAHSKDELIALRSRDDTVSSGVGLTPGARQIRRLTLLSLERVASYWLQCNIGKPRT